MLVYLQKIIYPIFLEIIVAPPPPMVKLSTTKRAVRIIDTFSLEPKKKIMNMNMCTIYAGVQLPQSFPPICCKYFQTILTKIF